MKRSLKMKVGRLLGMSSLYQSKRAGGTEERWGLINAHLDGDDGTLLDIGCNLGVLTRNAATTGRTALGVDVMEKAIAQARNRNRDVQGLAFMQMELTPETVQRLPTFDVVMCLSVHHYWVAAYGQETAWSMVRELISRSRRKFFFEPASIRKKYGQFAPDFVDLDRDSLKTHHLSALRDAAGAERQVEFLGESKCLGIEPFRLMFLVSA